MGGFGYVLADLARYTASDEVIFEAGSGPDSTPYLARVAHLYGVQLISVDVSDGHDAVDWLAATTPTRRIRFAYLDSWDWPYPGLGGYGEQVEAEYAARGAAYGEDPSAAHHLALAEQVARRALPGALVVFDDTWLTPEGWTGKGRDAVPWLLNRGWGLFARHLDEKPEPSRHNAFYAALERS